MDSKIEKVSAEQNHDYYLEQLKTEIRIGADGSVTLSMKGMSRLADVDDEAIRRNLLKNGCADQKLSKMAETLIKHGFNPADLPTWCSQGIPDTAAIFILEYYAFDAGSNRKAQALTYFRLLAHEGIRQWAYRVAGWSANENSGNIQTQKFLEMHFPLLPEKAVCRFKPEFWAALERLYGIKQGWPGCAPIIWNYVYGAFPVEIRERLKEVCPYGENGTRVHKLHRHFSPEAIRLLEERISIVTTNLIKAKSRQEFKELMKQVKPYSFNSEEVKALSAPSTTPALPES